MSVGSWDSQEVSDTVIILLDPECGVQDSEAQEEPPAPDVSSRPAQAKLQSSIYTETVHFLLQNSALQVKTRWLMSQLDSDWSNMYENDLSLMSEDYL